MLKCQQHVLTNNFVWVSFIAASQSNSARFVVVFFQYLLSGIPNAGDYPQNDKLTES